ncbi:hypothetical protein [Saccharolobus islandicus]|uniref:hypothetical protein n=1 Tax=Saccharolobus islandicus TaxID=43080 RepID=UPI000AA6B87E|nr:hypothetical protein [Sulfolobus islandicus]
MREIESLRSTTEILNNILLMTTTYLQSLYPISSLYAPPFRVLRIEYDNEGNPIYFTTYGDWLKYVRDSNLEETVLPDVNSLDLEEVMKDLGWEYKIEIKHNLTPVDQEAKIIYLSDCSLVKRVEYIVLSLTLINGLGEEIIPVCGEFTMDKYKGHLSQQLYWLSK